MENKKLKSIFRSDNRSVIIALDHIGSGFMEGWLYPSKTIKHIVDGNPDAVLLNMGILKSFHDKLNGKIAMILRVDGGATDVLEKWPNLSHWEALYNVEDAIKVGASSVMVTIFIGNQLESVSMKIAAKTISDCLKFDVPCGVQAVPIDCISGQISNDPEQISYAVRIAYELGADYINSFYTENQTSHMEVIKRSCVPIVISGGQLLNNQNDFYLKVFNSLCAGGAGIIVGRNVWQNQNPEKIIDDLHKLVHQNYCVKQLIQD
jgi:class I fructose-bisphosphate aldolase